MKQTMSPTPFPEDKKFPHMCRNGHEPIGFCNGPAEELESCPVCLAMAEIEQLKQRLDEAATKESAK